MINKTMKIVIIGIILLIGGVIGAVVSFMGTIKDPSDGAKATLDLGYPDYSETVYLDKGDYDIWYEGDSFFNDPGDVTVTDSDDNVVYESSSSSFSEGISVNNKEFTKEGSFTADNSGEYTLSAEEAITLYITPPINVALGMGLCFTGVIIGIIGGIIMLLGLFLHFTSKDKPPQQYPMGQYPAQQPPPYPQQPQQYPMQQYPAQYPPHTQQPQQYPQQQYPQQQQPYYPPQQPPQYSQQQYAPQPQQPIPYSPQPQKAQESAVQPRKKESVK